MCPYPFGQLAAMASSAVPCVSVLCPHPPPSHGNPQTLLDVRVKEIIADEGNQFREKSTPGKFSVQPLPLLSPPHRRSDPLNQKRKYGCRKADGTRPLGDPVRRLERGKGPDSDSHSDSETFEPTQPQCFIQTTKANTSLFVNTHLPNYSS